MRPQPATSLLDLLRARRLLAIVRGDDPAAALRSIDVLADEGVTLMEVSLSGAGALTVIRKAAAALGADVRLGAGTVLTARDAVAARDAGATFVVTPGLGDGVAEALRLGLPVLAGALTPTEVIAAVAQGATAVKLFPASSGGVPYLRALRDPFPAVPFVPVGGVGLDSVRDYLAAGAIAVGVGSPLLGDAPSGGDLAALRRRARAALDQAGPR
ncbi:bifunctional 4-hydroxy-2-oxoglutarate aldolase/2-dehydro-3-deoxy-phosphogluconate aldolase [Acrocarpospora macrocephala]|uniref:bifunctional 4-hydroxy-2-oxoglutarate aldolase/2-dehydro-3-deoxy-phosphogluconate aldolase n=1 Tax=Acrocarpospora macrocephala TaxID=150177 RepID=UPI001C3FDFF4|nr:bifunctional 4-hydroxy-2-oxoglutarate aldolase/2-dehydro-3-deoxy-phosphogluconate aldolase [Acrocarpospora macrocephala]